MACWRGTLAGKRRLLALGVLPLFWLLNVINNGHASRPARSCSRPLYTLAVRVVPQSFFPYGCSGTAVLLTLILSVHVVAAFPQVDFERMGNVGFAGAFASLDLFQNSSVSFDPTSSTVLLPSSDGFLRALRPPIQGAAF